MNEENENTTTGVEPTGPSAAIGETETPEGVTLTKLQAENEELRAALRSSEARTAMSAALLDAGARSPGLLFDAVAGDVEFGEDGKPRNIGELVTRLRAAYPEQFGIQVSGSIDAGAGQTAMPRLTRETLARMKPAEIAELDWGEVRQVLAAS